MEIFFMLPYFLLFLFLSYFFFRRWKKCLAKLPPGWMGLPYVGETAKFYSQEPTVFFDNKQKRYGDIFKTHILGCPSIILGSSEAARFVLVSHAHLFKPTYPKSKERMIGPHALIFHQGDYHSQLRRLVLSSLSGKYIQDLVPDIEALAISALESLVGSNMVNTFNEMKKFSFDVGILLIFGDLDHTYKQQLKENYCILNKGYNCMIMNIPGTTYYKAIRARNRISQLLKNIICERREKRQLKNDLLHYFLHFKDENGKILTDDEISDNIVGVLFAAHDTTASLLTWIVKYLHDHRKLFEDVKAEQMSIYESTMGGMWPLTWDETRNMPLTSKLIMESLRLSSILSFTFREAIVDIEYKGYRIPKGWKVMPLFRSIHHNPEFYPNPLCFDTSRFEATPKPYTFMAFGIGAHSCPGRELAKVEVMIMVHHLITKYRWELLGPEGVQYGPFVIPKNGLPARFRKEA